MREQHGRSKLTTTSKCFVNPRFVFQLWMSSSNGFQLDGDLFGVCDVDTWWMDGVKRAVECEYDGPGWGTKRTI